LCLGRKLEWTARDDSGGDGIRGVCSYAGNQFSNAKDIGDL